MRSCTRVRKLKGHVYYYFTRKERCISVSHHKTTNQSRNKRLKFYPTTSPRQSEYEKNSETITNPECPQHKYIYGDIEMYNPPADPVQSIGTGIRRKCVCAS